MSLVRLGLAARLLDADVGLVSVGMRLFSFVFITLPARDGHMIHGQHVLIYQVCSYIWNKAAVAHAICLVRRANRGGAVARAGVHEVVPRAVLVGRTRLAQAGVPEPEAGQAHAVTVVRRAGWRGRVVIAGRGGAPRHKTTTIRARLTHPARPARGAREARAANAAAQRRRG